LNANAARNLGIKKSKSFWKCYIGEQATIDPANPFNQEISLEKFTTDKPRRIDTTAIEDSALKMIAGLGVLISALVL
jgi:hypothetical protein